MSGEERVLPSATRPRLEWAPASSSSSASSSAPNNRTQRPPAGGTVRLGAKGVPSVSPCHVTPSNAEAVTSSPQKERTMGIPSRTADPGLGGWFLLPWWEVRFGIWDAEAARM